MEDDSLTALTTAGRICTAMVLFLVVVLVLAAGTSAWAADPRYDAPRQQAGRILGATAVQGGLVVHLGCGDGRLTAALRANRSFMVHGLDADPANVDKAREYIQSLGLYGTSVSVDRIAGKQLPYVDNLVNLVVAEDLTTTSTALSEVIRVLCPGGVAYVKQGGKWTHYTHDPSNNAVAHDSVVGPPRHLQWQGGSRWSRMHGHMTSVNALVSANGRPFYIFDEGSRVAIELPPERVLIARDAFNGTVLWKRPIPKWHTHLWPLKSGPAHPPRRIVAIGDVLYATLGIDAPVSALDAATGETIRTYAGDRRGDRRRRQHGPAPARSPTRAGFSKDRPMQGSGVSEADEWPTYRGGASRSGFTATKCSTDLKPAWETELGGRLSSPVIAGGKVLLTSVDTHQVLARRADTGKPVWSYTAGDRVDSPPTIYQGRVLFGSAGGWVYCLRSSDGELAWRFRAAPRRADRPAAAGFRAGRIGLAGTRQRAGARRRAVLRGRTVRLPRRLLVASHLLGPRPQFYRWTTPLEYHLFAAGKQPPELPLAPQSARRSAGSMVRFEKTESLNPAGKPLAVEAWVKAEGLNGVIVARGGPAQGYALLLRGGRPRFAVRSDDELFSVTAKQRVVGDWVHLAGVLTPEKKLQIYVNGKLAGAIEDAALIASDPVQPLVIGAGDQTAVGDYKSPYGFSGLIDEVRVYHGTLSAAEIAEHCAEPGSSAAEHDWTDDLPILVRAMVLADKTLFIAGPPDVIDEEDAYQTFGEPETKAKLARQNAALNGRLGAVLMAVSATDGSELARCDLKSIPQWDGMAAAGGRLYFTTVDGKLVCLTGK